MCGMQGKSASKSPRALAKEFNVPFGEFKNLKWKTKGEMHGAGRITRARVDIVAVFQAHWTDNRFPAHSGSNRKKPHVKRIMGRLTGDAEGKSVVEPL